jgi:hypothetical protein
MRLFRSIFEFGSFAEEARKKCRDKPLDREGVYIALGLRQSVDTTAGVSLDSSRQNRL